MKAYIYQSNVQLHPFNEPAPDWRIGEKTLASIQDTVLTSCGFRPVRVPDRQAIADISPHLILSDALYLTAEGLRAFLATAGNRSARCVAAPGLFASRVLWHMAADGHGRVPLPLWYNAGPGDPLANEPADRVVVLDEDTFDARMPAHMGTAEGKGLEQLMTRRPMIEIVSWVNLWQANMQCLFAATQRAKRLPWWKGLAVYLAGRGNLFRMMSRLNRIGKGCRIHPTAVVELSEIGDNVEIGAYAVVRMAIVGDGALIDDHASVRACVVGAGASIANNNNVLLSVVYPRAFLISGPYQFSMFGADTAIMHCICCDTRLDGHPIRADVGENQELNTPLRYLGSCYGHRVRAGAGTITAPGRAIPNDFFFLPPPMSVVQAIDPALPPRRNLITENGGLAYKGRPISGSSNIASITTGASQEGSAAATVAAADEPSREG